MALLKATELDNGVVVNYHRIGYINNVINNQTIIRVESYIDQEKRNAEKNAIKEGKSFNTFISGSYFNLPYDAEMDVVKAYNYLKTLDEFKDSENV